MKQKIIDSITDPSALEKLYRENNKEFRSAFTDISDAYDSELVNYWKIRLAPDAAILGGKFLVTDIWVLVLLAFFTGLLVKLPALFSGMDEEFFYPRNLAIIVFNGFILYTFWLNRFSGRRQLVFYFLVTAVCLVYLNFLPEGERDSVTLAFIHTPLLMWSLFGLAYLSFDHKSAEKRMDFIRYNGEFLVMTGLILIAGGLLAGITISLFSVIGMRIEEFYMENIAVFGAVAAPVLSVYLIRFYPNITSRISPVIARVFTPLVLITMLVYLGFMISLGNKILKDRELLLLLNVMIVAVMAIIVFSVTELDKTKSRSFHVLVLLLMAFLAIVINSIALVAIVTRVTYGLTPNRLVVLLSNLLIFINLVLLAKDLYKSYFNIDKLEDVEKTIARYLNVYVVYTLFVIFMLPLIFGYI